MPKQNQRKLYDPVKTNLCVCVFCVCVSTFVCLSHTLNRSLFFIHIYLYLGGYDWILCSLNESKPDWRWQLTASGRFAHRKEYVLTIGRQHGLELIHYESLDGFRHENGKDVHGHLFVMQKQRQSPKKNNDDDGDDNNYGSNIISNSDEL